MYDALYRQMKKMLGHLDQWIVTATEYARSRSFDPNVFLSQRLAPDQLPFVNQIRIACDTAKLSISRITGKDAPAHADDETTIEQLRARIAQVIAYLDGFSAKDFESAATRTVSTPRWGEKVLTAHDYFVEHAQPNFYFHVAHAYALLRHSGVPLGKKDYLGQLSFIDPK